MQINPDLFTRFDPLGGTIEGAPQIERRLSDMRGAFADEDAFNAALAQGDPVLYTLAAVAPAHGDGALHYAIAQIAPGRIGAEYYMTKGHYHAWRPAAEVYIGLSGTGFMLLEEEESHESRLLPLTPNAIVYVPGHTAHRTINTGEIPLTYLGIYPAAAGHDYGSIATENFRKILVAVNGEPTLVDR
ncbi:MAG: glucose-6-phosphate isomerase [Caldilineaceae bacterium]|nr:glucose-6-phosphate isomerase [Caldilineaceae bacterium]